MFIRRGKHPHEVALLLAIAVIGVFGTFAFNRSATTAARELAHPYGQLMYGGMTLGSAVALVGIFWPGITGALIERSGLKITSLLCLGQGAATIYMYGLRGLAFGLILAAFAVASLVRVHQIQKETREIIAADAFLGREERPGGAE